MAGETNLTILLREMRPVLQVGEYVFCSVESQKSYPTELQPIGLFYEPEGLTLILKRDRAEAAALSYTGVFRMITLSVHSSLEAIGFLATIASKLADYGISVNPVSAYYHDHLFIPAARAEEAMALLQAMTTQ